RPYYWVATDNARAISFEITFGLRTTARHAAPTSTKARTRSRWCWGWSLTPRRRRTRQAGRQPPAKDPSDTRLNNRRRPANGGCRRPEGRGAGRGGAPLETPG